MNMQFDDIYQRFGGLIKKHRRGMCMTQDELATKVNLSRASIANIESGRQKILLHQVYVFAKFLNMKPTDLLPKTDIFEQSHHSPKLKTKKDKAWVSAIMKQAENA